MKHYQDKDMTEALIGSSRRNLIVAAALAATVIMPGVSSADIAEGIDSLAEQIVARSAAADRTTIAIASFPHVDDTCSELSNFLVDELVLSLFSLPDTELSIIERSQLDRIFSELELSLSGAVDANTTKELGRVHGVETLLVGTLTNLGDDLRVNARLIDTETAQVYSAAAINIPRTSTFEELMARPASGGCTMAASREEASPGGQAAAQGRPAPSFEISLPDIDEDFQISNLEGNWSGQLNCVERGIRNRSLRLDSPSRIGLTGYYFDSAEIGNTYRHPKVSFSYNMSEGTIKNEFLLNVGPGVRLQLIAPGVLYGEFVDEEGDNCTLYLGKYDD